MWTMPIQGRQSITLFKLTLVGVDRPELLLKQFLTL